MSNAIVQSGTDLVRQDTGEVIGVAQFSMTDYLATVNTDAAFKAQQQLAAAYDKACASLIGENDVQREGSRTFKKKSAWRKLARHFNISTDVLRVEREYLNEYFLATVTVRARGPWGQSAEAVGACCTDEATGRRVITIADAIATAETRATNRAVSNLIAMGEVSAEEMSGKPADVQGGPSRPSDDRPPEQKRMPFGKTKGTPLGELPDDDLQSAAAWCREKGKFLDVAEACESVLAGRKGAARKAPARGNVMDPQDYDESAYQAQPEGGEEELPF